MKRSLAYWAAVLLAAFAAGAALPGSATAAAATEAPIRLAQSEVSLDEAVRIVRSRYDGEVIGAETRRDGGRTVHYVRVLSSDGKKVRTVRVDGRTGRVY